MYLERKHVAPPETGLVLEVVEEHSLRKMERRHLEKPGGRLLEQRADAATTSRVVYRPISELKLDPRNPRVHSARQVRQIARSIGAFGFNVPVLVDANGNVIAGHGRILACKLLGLSEVPTICLDHLTNAQVRAFMIADNRLTENSVWDERMLAEQLKELSILDLDFALEDTGFEMGEIDIHIQGLDAAHDREDDPGDAMPKSSGWPVSRAGDLWILGKNRVYCGNALEEPAYAALMCGEQAAMVISDPPWNRVIENNVSGLGAVQHRELRNGVRRDERSRIHMFLTRACSLLAEHSVGGSIHFIFMDWRHMPELLTAGREIYTELKNLCIWTKNHTGMGAFYRSRHELVFVFKHGSGLHRNNIQLGKYGRDRTNVWTYPSPRTPTDEGNLLALHPTVNPSPSSQTRSWIAGARRYRPRRLPWQRQYGYCRRAHRPTLLRNRDRSDLCRYHRSPLAGVYSRNGTSRDQRQEL